MEAHRRDRVFFHRYTLYMYNRHCGHPNPIILFDVPGQKTDAIFNDPTTFVTCASQPNLWIVSAYFSQAAS